MSNVTKISTANTREIALIRRTVAADTNNDEFDIFTNYCRTLGLDPLRRQIYAMVYNKDNPKKRKMSIVIGIDGFRSVAARSGNYRPDDEDAVFETDDKAKGPANPLGLVKATVKVWQFSHGQWFPVKASAFWDEYAPQKIQDGAWPDGNPKFRPVNPDDPQDGRIIDTSGKWGSMPRMMLAKCAEALALRKAWPEDFSNVYAQEEMDRSVIELSGSEAAKAGEADERLLRIGGGGRIMFDMLDGSPLVAIPHGEIADRIMAFVKDNNDEPSQIGLFRVRNRYSLQEFWAHSPGDALEVKHAMETVIGEEAK